MNYGVEITEYKDKTIGLYGGKFLPLHMGHVNCIIKASQMVDILFVEVGYDDDWDMGLCKNTEFTWVNHRQRERWVSEVVRSLPNVRVVSQYEQRFDEWQNRDEIRLANNQLLDKIGGRLDYVFSSEKSYDEYFSEYLPMAKHIILDSNRNEINISATKIREDGVYKHWNKLPRAVQNDYVKVVALCGIESTGKSTLTKILSTLYNTNFVEEYGRTYYDNLGGCFDIDKATDYIEIALKHNSNIIEAKKRANKILFVDTDNVYTQYYYTQSNQGKYYYEPVLDKMITNDHLIDSHIYINHEGSIQELDGTRSIMDELGRIDFDEKLRNLYADYDIEFNEINSSRDIESCIKIINELIK